MKETLNCESLSLSKYVISKHILWGIFQKSTPIVFLTHLFLMFFNCRESSILHTKKKFETMKTYRNLDLYLLIVIFWRDQKSFVVVKHLQYPTHLCLNFILGFFGVLYSWIKRPSDFFLQWHNKIMGIHALNGYS